MVVPQTALRDGFLLQGFRIESEKGLGRPSNCFFNKVEEIVGLATPEALLNIRRSRKRIKEAKEEKIAGILQPE